MVIIRKYSINTYTKFLYCGILIVLSIIVSSPIIIVLFPLSGMSITSAILIAFPFGFVIAIMIGEIYTKVYPLSVIIEESKIGIRSLYKMRFFHIDSIVRIHRINPTSKAIVFEKKSNDSVNPHFYSNTWGVEFRIEIVDEGQTKIFRLVSTISKLNELVKNLIYRMS